MDQSLSAIITSRDGACALIERYFEDLDDAVFAPTVCGMTDDDKGAFAIMRGWYNEMSLFTQARYLLDKHRFITRDEGFGISGRKKDLRAARQLGCWDARASERGT